ncbi:MAG: hypothetical protein IT437_12915 [Phycisphaerales bacterium]|nr:hypothetical protein [Phycisphaerales bacterium]
MRWAAAILIPVLGAAGPAPAQPDARPSGTEVTVIVREGARQRSSPAGGALAALAADSGRLSDLSVAWSEFAAELGWSTPQAFDALLGSRVMVVLRGLTPAGAAHWALLSEVTSDAEKRLISALRPAPRGTVGGYTVLAIEHGRYELAIARGGWRDDSPHPAVILLAPARDRDLFDALIPALSAPRFGGEAEGGDAAVTIRRPAPPAFDGGLPRTSTVTLSATLDPDGAGWTCRLLGDAGAVSPITPWSTAAFEGLQRDGMVAVMGVLGAPPLTELGRWLGVPSVSLPAGPAVGERVALVVRESGARALMPALASGAVRAAAHRDAGSASLAVTLAIEARDLPALIPTADTLSASLVPFLNGQGSAPVATAVEFDTGLRERSVRAVDLFPAKGSLAAGFSPHPMLTWAFARSRPSFQRLAGVKSGDDGAPGWWVLSLSSGEAAAACTPSESVRDLLSREMPDPLQVQRLSVGMVRPALLESAPGLPEALTDALRGGRWVESIRWDSWLRADGRAEGEVRVRMNTAR